MTLAVSSLSPESEPMNTVYPDSGRPRVHAVSVASQDKTLMQLPGTTDAYPGVPVDDMIARRGLKTGRARAD